MSSAPEIRFDPLTGLRTILAPSRADRPDAFSAPPALANADAAANCPFCEGREDRTPAEVWADRPEGGADTPGWRVRSVPNLYPALGAAAEDGLPAPAARRAEPAGDPLGEGARGAQPELLRSRSALGAHEVIVHCPEHLTRLDQLEAEQLEVAIAGWRARMAAHVDAAYVQLIVNEGPQAGASLEHSHAQLYALDFVPAVVARERERFSTHHEQTLGGHLYEDILAEEVRRGERIVAVDDECVLLCPWASPSPFAMRIVPRRSEPDFAASTGGARALSTAIGALSGAFGTPPQLNLWVRTAPRGIDEFCWRIEIAPRLITKAGFELSTGVDINTYPPERAADDLRAALGAE